jgi:hypothetical protein
LRVKHHNPNPYIVRVLKFKELQIIMTLNKVYHCPCICLQRSIKQVSLFREKFNVQHKWKFPIEIRNWNDVCNKKCSPSVFTCFFVTLFYQCLSILKQWWLFLYYMISARIFNIFDTGKNIKKLFVSMIGYFVVSYYHYSIIYSFMSIDRLHISDLDFR